MVTLEIPGADASVVSNVLSQVQANQETLQWESYSISLPPLAEIFRKIFEQGMDGVEDHRYTSASDLFFDFEMRIGRPVYKRGQLCVQVYLGC